MKRALIIGWAFVWPATVCVLDSSGAPAPQRGALSQEAVRVRSGRLEQGVYGIAILGEDGKTPRVVLYVDDKSGLCGIRLHDAQGREGSSWTLSADGAVAALDLGDADESHNGRRAQMRYKRGQAMGAGIFDRESNMLAGVGWASVDDPAFPDLFTAAVGDAGGMRAGLLYREGGAGLIVTDEEYAAQIVLSHSNDKGAKVVLPD